MKKLLLFLLVVIASVDLSGEIAVKSFRKLDNDLDARVNFPLKDQNGKDCAIIKVVTTQTGFNFDGGQLGIVKTVQKASEIWMYVPYGLKRLSIFHPQLGQLRDYIIPINIDQSTVYEMILVSGKVTTFVEETIESQWLVITPEPANALVYINDEFVKSGIYQAKLKPGNYNYRVEAPLYHPLIGVIQIAGKKEELKAQLKPNYGYITITSSPEIDAQILIDDKPFPVNTPATTDKLKSGEYTVRVIKEMYQPYMQRVIVNDDKTTEINAFLQPNFAELTINASTDAAIYINNVLKGKGSWNGRLTTGVFSLEARLNQHRNAKQDIELNVGEKRIVNLQPRPICGSLDVITNPQGATITVDGKEYGKTPNTIRNLLIGDYKLQLSKAGFGSIQRNIHIEENNELIVNEKLINGRIVTINSNPSGAKLVIDNIDVGKTPYSGLLTYGSYKLSATLEGLTNDLDIEVNESGKSNFILNLGKKITIDADIKRCQVYINNQLVGFNPYTGNLDYGKYKVSVVREGRKFEKDIVVYKNNTETDVYFDIKKLIRVENNSGPANLFLSVLVPGLGDYNVTKREQNGVETMLWSYGLILSGVGCKLYSNSVYAKYHLATDQTEMDNFYTEANYANYGFYALVATGLAVWIYDIFWVANKGVQNKKGYTRDQISLIYDPSIQMAGITYKIKF